MCGLAGTLIFGNPTADKISQIKSIFTQNLLANEERGKDATGIATLNKQGSSAILKHARPAGEFITHKDYTEFIDQHITGNTSIILGHTRLPTKGSPDNDSNNHPIRVGNIVGIHNGTITNDDEVFLNLSKRQEKISRIGSVDSESIFTLIDSIPSALSEDNYLLKVTEASKQLIGSYASLFFNHHFPQYLFLLKYETPISVHYSVELEALFFSSRYVFLRKAFGKSVITEALPNRTAYLFDGNLLKDLHKRPKLHYPLPEMRIH